MTRKVFIVDGFGTGSFETMFKEYGWEIAKSVADADLIQFTGGADINPKLYGCAPHESTYFWDNRDQKEIMFFNIAKQAKIPMAGVCRGAQLINALCGGSMFQDVDGHMGNHLVTNVETGDQWRVNSIHHQMMIPTQDCLLIDYAQGVSTYRDKVLANGKTVTVTDSKHREPETIFYEEIKGLGIQGHPEMGSNEMRKRYFQYIDRYCFGLEAAPPKTN